jgi:hypothetical protein
MLRYGYSGCCKVTVKNRKFPFRLSGYTSNTVGRVSLPGDMLSMVKPLFSRKVRSEDATI